MAGGTVIGIDIGTSGCKTILVDEKGKIIASALEEYPLFSLRHGWSEQRPDDWWNAVVKTIKSITSRYGKEVENLRGIGLTGQMHGLVALDERNEVIRPAILWNDQRTEVQCREIYDKVGGEETLLKYTNNRMLPGYTGGKILWVRENEPENYEKIKHIVNPKDYIRYRLTGVIATEVSDASGTGFFDVKNRRWSKELLEILDIPLDFFPDCYESVEVSGSLLNSIADELGLPRGLKVVGGGGDAVIQGVGTGVISSDVCMTVMGTSGIVSTTLEDYKDNPDGLLQVFCNVVPGTWHAMGVTLSAAGSLKWAREVFAHSETEVGRLTGENVYSLITREAFKAPIGAGGVFFLPYLSGERCPYTDPDARGAFVGLTLNTTKSELFRSIMEGVVFSLRDVNEIFKRIGMSFDHVATSGGGAQSDVWRQIHADVFRMKVETVSGSREGAAYGAAVVAGVGTGLWGDFEEAASLLSVESVNEPDSSNSDRYDRLYAIYHGLYSDLKESFKRIAELSD